MSDFNRADPERAMEFAKDSHVRQAVQRTLRALEVVGGIRDVPEIEEAVRDVAFSLSILEANPERPQTYGRVMVVRGPMDGYSLWVRAADVYNLHLDSFRDGLFDRFKEPEA